MKTVAIVSARLGSTRFPNKVLTELWNGETVLSFLIKRLKMSKVIDDIIVATTSEPEDLKIKKVCDDLKVYFVNKGSPDDNIKSVIEAINFYERITLMDCLNIIDITADCPFVDPFLIDDLFYKYLNNTYHYFSNVCTRSFPIGFDIQIYNSLLFENINKIVTYKEHRSHSGWNIMNYWDELTQEVVQRISMGNYSAKDPYFHPEWRIVVDYPEDLLFLKLILNGLNKIDFTYKEVIDFILKNPELLEINKNCKQKIAGKE
jgi:spore coat polysaccharide biosynthesis protein SpsF